MWLENVGGAGPKYVRVEAVMLPFSELSQTPETLPGPTRTSMAEVISSSLEIRDGARLTMQNMLYKGPFLRHHRQLQGSQDFRWRASYHHIFGGAPCLHLWQHLKVS